jgi:hypothetical protein
MPDSLALSIAADLATRLVEQEGSAEAARSFLLRHYKPEPHDELKLGRLLAAVSRVKA